ncbi:hypothetical protein ABZX72_34400 [Streptomyces cyaneofuscatus]|uniref:hypothetical protein n=1 Tax=Streptomyces cyaneofuscatus TaxID=66883 RepID=UPI0033BAEE64
MGMIFGFSDGEMAPVPDELRDQVESTVTLSGGQTYTDTNGDTYTTTQSGEDKAAGR